MMRATTEQFVTVGDRLLWQDQLAKRNQPHVLRRLGEGNCAIEMELCPRGDALLPHALCGGGQIERDNLQVRCERS